MFPKSMDICRQILFRIHFFGRSCTELQSWFSQKGLFYCHQQIQGSNTHLKFNITGIAIPVGIVTFQGPFLLNFGFGITAISGSTFGASGDFHFGDLGRDFFGSMQKSNGHRNELRKKKKLATPIRVSIRTGCSTMENQNHHPCNDGKSIIPILSTPDNPRDDFLHCS